MNDPEARMSAEDAEEYTASLGQSLGGNWRMTALAVRLGVPRAMGLTTEEWIERLGGHVKMAITDRRRQPRPLRRSTTGRRGRLGQCLVFRTPRWRTIYRLAKTCQTRTKLAATMRMSQRFLAKTCQHKALPKTKQTQHRCSPSWTSKLGKLSIRKPLRIATLSEDARETDESTNVDYSNESAVTASHWQRPVNGSGCGHAGGVRSRAWGICPRWGGKPRHDIRATGGEDRWPIPVPVTGPPSTPGDPTA